MASPLICERQPLTRDERIEPWLDEDWTSDVFSVSRNDITFENIAKDVVAIEVRIVNQSPRTSTPTPMVLQAAPIGAFLPWQPLATLHVPALRPGQAMTLRTLAQVLQPRPLGDPARIPPKKLLTALGLADEPPRRPMRKKRSADPSLAMGQLPADAMELLMPGKAHWMGNINVLIGKVDVERHLGGALRVVPGRGNVAWFMVGSTGRDAYAFHMNPLGREWDAKLYDATSQKAVILKVAEAQAIAPRRWIASSYTRVMLLSLYPPGDAAAGTVEIHVAQRSTGREAVVEFSVDPNAAGPGCYVV